jgi:hypothetical protein
MVFNTTFNKYVSFIGGGNLRLSTTDIPQVTAGLSVRQNLLFVYFVLHRKSENWYAGTITVNSELDSVCSVVSSTPRLNGIRTHNVGGDI